MDIQPSKDTVYQLQGDIRVVVGSTTIQHNLRAKLKLSMTEYVLLDFIHQWHLKKKEPITFGDYWRATGVKSRLLSVKFQRLKDKGMLFKDDTDGKVKTTDLWNSNFNSSEQFETLWKLLNVGNKQVAKKSFSLAMKVDSYENIKLGLEKYLAFLKLTDQFPKHLSSFLNPKNKDWTTERDAGIYAKKKEPLFTPKPQVSTGPKSKF
jgi:hypothetical protein